nr:TRAP transporter substrate-binding protein DctP [Micromonospora sp. DSM 115978]
MKRNRLSGSKLVAAGSLVGLFLAACGQEPAGLSGTELSFAHSYGVDHPHHRCGAQIVADEVNGQELGITIKVYPNSRLGNDADRYRSISSGEIDIDLQGSSALGAAYEPIGVFDAAYAFNDADHLFAYFASDSAESLKEDFRSATDVRVLSAWYFGMRHFTATKPIRRPADLRGLRMRFPDSPTYLANAEALGADATAVAFEELGTALRDGVIDGQENSIPTIDDLDLGGVQSHVSLTGHQTGSQLVVIAERTWNELSAEQQAALGAAVELARERDRNCIEQTEHEVMGMWSGSGELAVVDDVDRDAFAARAERYFESHLTGASLELYRSIRSAAR